MRDPGRSGHRASAAALLTVASTILSAGGCSSGGDGVSGAFTIASDVPSGGIAVGWGEERYLVTFSEAVDETPQDEDLVGVRLTRDGEVVDGTPFLLSDFGGNPYLSADARYSSGDIAFADGTFGIFFFGTGTYPNDGPPGQVVSFVSLPEDGLPVLPAYAIDDQESFSDSPASLRPPIAATAEGTSFLGVYQRILSPVGFFSISEVVGRLVTPASGISWQPVGPFTGIGELVVGRGTSGSAPGAATGSAGTLLAWVQETFPLSAPADVSTQVQALLFTPNGNFFSLSDTAAGSQNAAVASDGGEFLVVWTATTAKDPTTLREVRAIRVASDGRAEPEGGFLVEGGATAKSLAGAVFAEGVYLVAWIEGGAVRGARLWTTGTYAESLTIDPGPATSAALSTDGSRFLAVFNRANGTSSSDVLGRFVE